MGALDGKTVLITGGARGAGRAPPPPRARGGGDHVGGVKAGPGANGGEYMCTPAA
ncbi:NAD(P)-dependent dehydrogenase (short-subunit alcohol dehydrogenase family), partial [Mycobacterium frederiksbergense]|nr:NAD(P)-dependent dehydrogenase (short-subunit alcohol dehydrogenase family) [Mycolicibacterium frederiksbergense]